MKVWEARKADGLTTTPEDERQQHFLAEITKYNLEASTDHDHPRTPREVIDLLSPMAAPAARKDRHRRDRGSQSISSS